MISMRRQFFLLLIFLITTPAFAAIRLPKIFNSHMVLQRQKPVPIWGWADAGEKVTVQLMASGSVKQSKQIKAGKDGKWKVVLEATEAGGPYQLVVKGKQTLLTLDDVLFGEVWLCSGQSNMDMLVNKAYHANEEKKNANYPQIRHFKVPRDRSLTPLDDITGGEWELTTPETVGNFSALGYFYAREL
jgi:sialate O-acetylesterase